MRAQSRGARSLNLCGFTCGYAARYPRAAPGPAPGSARRKGCAGTESFSQFSVPTIQAGRCHRPHSKPGDWEGEGEGERGVVLRQSDRSAPAPGLRTSNAGFSRRPRRAGTDAVRRGGGQGCLGPGRCCRTPPARRELPAGSGAAGGATRAPAHRASLTRPCLSFLTCAAAGPTPADVTCARSASTAWPRPPAPGLGAWRLTGQALPRPRGPRGGPRACAP